MAAMEDLEKMVATGRMDYAVRMGETAVTEKMDVLVQSVLLAQGVFRVKMAETAVMGRTEKMEEMDVMANPFAVP